MAGAPVPGHTDSFHLMGEMDHSIKDLNKTIDKLVRA